MSLYICLLGAAESLIPVQGKAIRGSQSSPTDTQLHQPGHSACSDVAKPQTTHPGTNKTCLMYWLSPVEAKALPICVGSVN